MFRMPEQIATMADRVSEDNLKDIIKASLLNPLKYFCPNGAQEQFIKAVAHSCDKTRVPVILSTFANGVGKTTVAAATAVQAAELGYKQPRSLSE